MKKTLLMFLILTASLSADEVIFEEVPPPVLYSESYFSEIQGITLSSSTPTDEQLAQKKTGIHFVNLDIPGEPSLLYQQLEPFLNQPLTTEEIAEVEVVVMLYYRERGYPQTTVQLNDDQLTEGLIWLVVNPQK